MKATAYSLQDRNKYNTIALMLLRNDIIIYGILCTITNNWKNTYTQLGVFTKPHKHRKLQKPH